MSKGRIYAAGCDGVNEILELEGTIYLRTNAGKRAMNEQIINIENWNRKLFYEKYREMYSPYVIITFQPDITGLLQYVRKNRLSLYFSLIYLCVKTADEIENFRYRFRGETPVLIDKTRAFATHLQPGCENFIEVDCDDYDDMIAFAKQNRAKADLPVKDLGIPQMAGRLDFINFSSIPWVTFTGFQRSISRNSGSDSIPKITFGKYFHQEGRTLLPLALQVHHGLVDGLHIGRFAEKLQHRLDEFMVMKHD